MGVIENRRRIIAAQPHLVTASGSAVLVTIAEPKIEHLRVTFSPVQTGSGTPSPSNVRPIMGWSTIAASIGTMPVDISLGGTYYGGTVDLVSGVMTVTKFGFTGNNPNAYAYLDSVQTNVVVFTINLSRSGFPNASGGIMASHFSPTIPSGTAGRVVLSGGYIYSVVPRSDFSGTINDEAVRTWLIYHNPTYVYTRTTPQTVQLSPQTIAALRGQQTTISPAGAVEISYWTH
jgi:hypothetical protein